MIALLLTLYTTPAVQAAPIQVGGYLRLMTRPDLQGGQGQLGYWNLYGRLLNEREYVMLDSRIQLLEAQHKTDSWSNLSKCRRNGVF